MFGHSFPEGHDVQFLGELALELACGEGLQQDHCSNPVLLQKFVEVHAVALDAPDVPLEQVGPLFTHLLLGHPLGVGQGEELLFG